MSPAVWGVISVAAWALCATEQFSHLGGNVFLFVPNAAVLTTRRWGLGRALGAEGGERDDPVSQIHDGGRGRFSVSVHFPSAGGRLGGARVAMKV